MSDVLQRIVTQRKVRLAEMQQHYPERDITTTAAQHTLQRRPRSLKKHLQAQQPGFILECKKASPSKGLIRDPFDPVAIARTYEPYAAAISVLTEPDFFQGSFSYLQAVRQQVRVPVLCKDFIFSRYQVALARYFDADAILLMLSILDDAQYLALRDYAEQLQLEVLTEVANTAEMERAVRLKAPIIGINHRDLTDLSVDLTRTERLAPLAPAGTLIVAESGIYQHQHVRDLAPHCHGFLVGSSLTAEADIDQACRRLIYGEHKVCGLTQPDQALVAAASGAVYGGLIFAKRSPRCLTENTAKQVIESAPHLHYVGVFSANDTDTHEQAIAHYLHLQAQLGLAAIQLHDYHPDSPDTARLLQLLRAQLPAECQLWLALQVTGPLTALPTLPVERFVLDHGQGGTGRAFNWGYLTTSLLEQQGHRILLAGGLGPDNVAQAASLGCAGLDFNSCLEAAPGVKDPHRIHTTFQNLRNTLSYVQDTVFKDISL
ncbi:bifunctional indole-3-glycerol-phosphate synthase TrpC/phosphoribosylanthranilate isomerase TrpF [Aliidiomarina taiwanensis]|uniref:Multifunctional fusion protein n=1 Tax=Aliidiomarina taiwanensis TaxID=946228 RepID=A0A432X1W8_9GAMM|nr:bifunctional indole-3-glycerol-phosphate synthase TrpC/phosphoribosylanthranilate isomerase TrpF [Aliidiomarina taiwanensis]RUO40539.1 bifunctional indole-3-glycerol-phosphate synthase TrpC/phosphoribosylanthranilate isomerase TrpF [Aliidiomarina taiwanensis]